MRFSVLPFVSSLAHRPFSPVAMGTKAECLVHSLGCERKADLVLEMQAFWREMLAMYSHGKNL
jgi:hypothetical protein